MQRYQSLLAEGANLEAHLEDGEPLDDWRKQLAQESVVHEVPVVDCVGRAVRLRCS